VIRFFDTSALALVALRQNGWELAAQLYESASEVIVAFHTRVEFYSALNRLQTDHAIGVTDAEQLYDWFDLESQRMRVIAFSDPVEQRALSILKQHQMKTLDCLQLACALESGSTLERFVSSDKRLARIAEKFGLSSG